MLHELDRLYAAFQEDAESAYMDLYRQRYEELYGFLLDEEPEEDELDELAEMYLAGMLDEPNEITKYAFEAELKRKRDRAKEAINAVPTKAQKQIELDKAGRYVIQQEAWYSDFTSQAAEIQAMKDAGVKKVRRHEMKDDKVCKVCRKLDGLVYDIRRVPPPAHINCRAWYEPI